MKESQFNFTAHTLLFPIGFTLAIWFVYWLEIRFNLNFNNLGVRPRNLLGLRGIVFSPFIHSSLSHLWHNTLPILILGTAIFYFYRQIALKVLIWGVLTTGLITWLIARPANHIGASGLIYFLSSFLFFKGIWSKHYRLIALSLVVIFVYGSLIWGTLPDAVDANVSWEGHLSGLIAGILSAKIFKNTIEAPKHYEWEKPAYNEEDDPFMQHFDDDGNFIEILPGEELPEDELKPSVNYNYKESKKND